MVDVKTCLDNAQEKMDMAIMYLEEALYGGVCLIEWPEKMAGWLPENCFKLTITPDASGRRITISSASAEKLSRLRKLELR